MNVPVSAVYVILSPQVFVATLCKHDMVSQQNARHSWVEIIKFLQHYLNRESTQRFIMII